MKAFLNDDIKKHKINRSLTSVHIMQIHNLHVTILNHISYIISPYNNISPYISLYHTSHHILLLVIIHFTLMFAKTVTDILPFTFPFLFKLCSVAFNRLILLSNYGCSSGLNS